MFAALWYKTKGSLPSNVNRQDPNVAYCEDMLCKVSYTGTTPESVVKPCPPVVPDDESAMNKEHVTIARKSVSCYLIPLAKTFSTVVTRPCLPSCSELTSLVT